MTTVACAVCGASYHLGDIKVLGHRDAMWFIRVSCASCASAGLVAAMVKSHEEQAPRQIERPDPALDRARLPGPITRAQVMGMRRYLDGFDGDFRALFKSDTEPDPPQIAT